MLRVFGFILLVKGIDLAGRDADPWLLIAWVATAAGVFLGYRMALPAVSVLAAAVFVAGFHNQHVWLLLWLPLTFLLPDVDRRWLWRWQATILYGFAAVAKLTPDYLSGAIIEQRLPGWPAGVLVGISLVGLATEAFLAFGLWRWWWAKIVGAGFHASIVAVMATGPVHVARLAVFGGLVLLLYAGFSDDAVDVDEPAGEVAAVGEHPDDVDH